MFTLVVGVKSSLPNNRTHLDVTFYVKSKAQMISAKLMQQC